MDIVRVAQGMPRGARLGAELRTEFALIGMSALSTMNSQVPALRSHLKSKQQILIVETTFS